MRGRAWTLEEDDAIRKAVQLNRGAKRPRPGALSALALLIGRTPAAVRKRAERIGAVSNVANRRLDFGRKRA